MGSKRNKMKNLEYKRLKKEIRYKTWRDYNCK